MRALVLLLMMLPGTLLAQIEQTPHTLKLEEGVARPAATLDDVQLLLGHWEGPFMGGTAEEIWLPVAGGTMLGMFRMYSEGELFFYELMHMVEEEGSVSLKLKHFNADLTGWEEKDDMVTFRFVKATAEGLWFEGLTFLKQADGSLQAYIALSGDDGAVSEESFVYSPIEGQ